MFFISLFLVYYPLDRLGSTSSVRRSRYPARRPLRKRARCGNLYATCERERAALAGTSNALEPTLGVDFPSCADELGRFSRSPIRLLFIPTKGPSSVKPGPLVHLEHKPPTLSHGSYIDCSLHLKSIAGPDCIWLSALSLSSTLSKSQPRGWKSTSAATVRQCSHLTGSRAHIQQADGTAFVPGFASSRFPVSKLWLACY
ncbi:hypothetical protein V8F33_000243 [Rhypophila sp. PSN 637]